MEWLMFRIVCLWVCMAYYSGNKGLISGTILMLGIEERKKKPLEKYETNYKIRVVSPESIVDYCESKSDVIYYDVIV